MKKRTKEPVKWGGGLGGGLGGGVFGLVGWGLKNVRNLDLGRAEARFQPLGEKMKAAQRSKWGRKIRGESFRSTTNRKGSKREIGMAGDARGKRRNAFFCPS